MIYLIGGAGRSGKTSLAIRLLREKSLPYFCTDFLMYSLASSGTAGIDLKTDTLNSVTSKMAPVLWYLIQAIVHKNHDYVVEGFHLRPGLIGKLKTRYSDKITGCVLGYPEISVAEKMQVVYRNPVQNDDWLATLPVESREKFVVEQIEASKQLRISADKHSIPFFDTGKRFEENLNAAIEQLTG